MTNILLAGATGLVGRDVLALLLVDPRVIRVVAPTRKALPAHPKLLNPIVDSVTLPLGADWWAVDGAICALGTTRAEAGLAAAFRAIDLDYALAIATQVRKRGARRFALTSSMGANVHSRFLYTRTKGELEDAIRRLDFASLTIVRPGVIGGERTVYRPGERIMAATLRLAAPILPAVARISPVATVAAFLVAAAIDGGPGEDRIGSAEIAVAASRDHR